MTGSGRIVTLDILRGVAVMGILAINIAAFALPLDAYLNPRALGLESDADLLSWAASFVLIEGKMRGLFSLLFGASMLLVIERAEAAGEPSDKVHFRRMGWLLLFGLLHYYFIWHGDILTLYAAVGIVAWFLHGSSPRALVRVAIALILLQFLLFALLALPATGLLAGPQTPPMPGQASAGSAIASRVAEAVALYRGSYGGIVHHQFTDGLYGPIDSILLNGAETLGYMLLGMAALKTGFITGSWSLRRYRQIAAAGFAMGIPLGSLLALGLIREQFSNPAIISLNLAATTLLRPIMIFATIALIILATRRGGALTDRIAAAGRAAFTNYLGTSILMTALFYGYGLGLFGKLSRAELWLVVVPAWMLMLLWSKPWLERYRYGPFEWLWRSLARGRPQPMRKNGVTG
ncbi:DUF418 domain-containing protein [Sphingomonas sp.]|uniref:DUF418 domain-containing protein n=1 Tax=Sphingomonas sp. TaxID=28214 RepID=UPI002FCB9BDD